MQAAPRYTDAQIEAATFPQIGWYSWCCGNTRERVTSAIIIIAFLVLFAGAILYNKGAQHYNVSVGCMGAASATLLFMLFLSCKKEQEPLSPILLEKVKRHTLHGLLLTLKVTHPKLQLGEPYNSMTPGQAYLERDKYEKSDIFKNRWQVNRSDTQAIDEHVSSYIRGNNLGDPETLTREYLERMNDIRVILRPILDDPRHAKLPADAQLSIAVSLPLKDTLSMIDEAALLTSTIADYHAGKSRK